MRSAGQASLEPVSGLRARAQAWGSPFLAAEYSAADRCDSGGTKPKARGQPPERMLFANASPPSTPSTPVKATLSPGVATPVIDATTLTPWLGPERAPPAPLPEIVETDELSDPAFADWLRAAPPPPRWVAAERAFLSRVRRECAVQLARAPNYPEAYGDRRLIRFLRQHKSEKKGVKAVKEYLRWREAEKIDLIRDQIMAGKDRPETWPSGAFFKARCAVLPCAECLFDVKGCVEINQCVGCTR